MTPPPRSRRSRSTPSTDAREEKPTVTLADGAPIEVGDETEVDVVSVPLSDLKGLSDACARGTSKTGLVVVP